MTTEVELPNPPQPPAGRRVPSSYCERHPDENFTGFCALCLRERLEGLESSTTTATTHRNSTSTISSSLKSIFFRPPSSNYPSSLPQLRRCKSFSTSSFEPQRKSCDIAPPRFSTSSFEPQRKSCDVRGRNTLWYLFNRDDNARTTTERAGGVVGSGTGSSHLPSTSSAAAIAVPAAAVPVEEEEEEEEDCDEIRPVDPVVLVVETSGEINNVVLGGERKGEEEEDDENENETELKPMKDHIDLESQSKKPPPKDFKEIAGSFWLAASVFSRKLQKWRRKQKLKKMKKEEGMAGNKTSSARFQETQSEVAFGRRSSCDTGPRFSLDAGRISFDDARYSLDEPRASWDGYLIGGGGGGGGGGSRLMFPRLPPMLSVVEDVPTPVVQRSDGQIPVEEDLVLPGGSAHTKDYYSDSSSRSRRRSLDRSNSIRKLSVEVNNDQKLPAAANARVSPAASTVDLFRDWSSNSLRSDRSESFESAFREDPHKLPPRKKSKRWSKAWSIWGFIHRRSSSSSRGGGANVVDRSFSESWPELRTSGYGNSKMLRSKSSVSSRSSLNGNAAFGSMRKNGMEMTNGNGKKGREEFALERNRSARYSPGHVDNGMPRFYLTSMRNSGRGLAKNVHNSSYQSFTRSVLRLY